MSARVKQVIPKPDFEIKGHMVNSERLSAHYNALTAALPKRLRSHANINEFLRSISEVVHNSEMSALPQNAGSKDTVAAPAKTRDAALAVTKHTASLLEALAALRCDALMDFDGQFTGLLHQRDRDQFIEKMKNPATPTHEIYGDAFLQKLWDDLTLLKEVVTMVADNLNVDPHSQPSKAHAKNIARGVAENWPRCFDEKPKANPNDAGKTSFTKFLRVLAEELCKSASDHGLLSLYTAEFTIGAAIAHDAIKK